VERAERSRPARAGRGRLRSLRCREELRRALPHRGTTVSVQEQTRRRIDAVRSTLFDKLVDAAERAVDVYIGVMDDEKAGPKYRMQAADRVLELMGFRDQVIQVEVKQTQEVSDLDRELLTVLQSVSEQRIIQAIEAVSTEVPSEPVREPSRA
jgi:hypothetical protein